MGKNITAQKRGKGTSVYRAPSFRYVGVVKHRSLSSKESLGRIRDIVHSTGHYAPILKVSYADGVDSLEIAPFGVKVGDEVRVGAGVDVKDGNVLPLRSIPEGAFIFNIESMPGDGGKFVRSSGSFARVVEKTSDTVKVMLPSKQERTFSADCRATIGVIAGGGRGDKPLLKAGLRSMKRGARGKLYPITSALSMNAVAHPFGGSSSAAKNGPLIARRFAPPGAKVGSLRPRRTGRRTK